MTIEVGGGGSGGLKPPTALDPSLIGLYDSAYGLGDTYKNIQKSGGTSSNTFVDVLDITGSGVLLFAAAVLDATGTVTMSVEIDGNNVMSGTINLAPSQGFAVTGAYHSGLFQDSPIVFNKSLKISIHTLGTRSARLLYKRYLT
tara:strand:+ start:1529 stop:1960 length:432 start_codon:yes stop_codon:yes gene_type:complete